jgi:mannose-6-phosphate isomerase-like protein (cupin superfamily)
MKAVKRYVSGIDDGETKILEQEEVGVLTPYPQYSCLQLCNLFYTEDFPQSVQTTHNNSEYDINLPQGAMRILTMRLPTKKEIIADLEKAGQETPSDWTKFNYHRTDSLDYIYILSGAITYVAGDETVELKQGDFLAQLAAEHTWINDHDEPCIALCVMQGIEKTGKSIDMEV